MEKSKFLFKLLIINLIIFFVACKAEKKQLADLIVLSELMPAGFKYTYFIGYDSFASFQQIQKNGYELPYAIDSEFVFIIKKKEFDTLLNTIMEQELNYANWDSLNLKNPNIIFARLYNQDTCYLIDFLANDFQNAMPRLWIEDAGKLSMEGNRLMYTMRYHSFLK